MPLSSGFQASNAWSIAVSGFNRLANWAAARCPNAKWVNKRLAKYKIRLPDPGRVMAVLSGNMNGMKGQRGANAARAIFFIGEMAVPG
jgi:hypothetical protein